jgi:hypothetical protein
LKKIAQNFQPLFNFSIAKKETIAKKPRNLVTVPLTHNNIGNRRTKMRHKIVPIFSGSIVVVGRDIFSGGKKERIHIDYPVRSHVWRHCYYFHICSHKNNQHPRQQRSGRQAWKK